MLDDLPPRYSHVAKLLTRTPWALRPEVLTGLVDVLRIRVSGRRLSADEISERIEARSGSGRENPPPSSGTVAIIPVAGVLFPKASFFTEISGATSVAGIQKNFRLAMGDPEIEAVVLDLDSPGGIVDQIPELAAEIRTGRDTKPIVAAVNTEAASAAYWLACQATEIVCTPSGMVGSVGVYAAHEDWSKAEEMEGVRTTLVSAGRYKTEGNPHAPLGEEAQAWLQEQVDKLYSMFTADVAIGRGTSQEAVTRGYGEGRMALAKDAVAQGMADSVGTLEQAVARARELARTPGARRAAAVADTPPLQSLTPGGVPTSQVAANDEELRARADRVRELYLAYPSVV